MTDDERWYWQLDFGSKLTIVSTLCHTMALNTTRSGGIIVGFKDNLAKHIDIVDTDSKYVVWFKCSEQLFKTDQPVFCGVIYIPPEYTKYCNRNTCLLQINLNIYVFWGTLTRGRQLPLILLI